LEQQKNPHRVIESAREQIGPNFPKVETHFKQTKESAQIIHLYLRKCHIQICEGKWMGRKTENKPVENVQSPFFSQKEVQ